MKLTTKATQTLISAIDKAITKAANTSTFSKDVVNSVNNGLTDIGFYVANNTTIRFTYKSKIYQYILVCGGRKTQHHFDSFVINLVGHKHHFIVTRDHQILLKNLQFKLCKSLYHNSHEEPVNN